MNLNEDFAILMAVPFKARHKKVFYYLYDTFCENNSPLLCTHILPTILKTDLPLVIEKVYENYSIRYRFQF